MVRCSKLFQKYSLVLCTQGSHHILFQMLSAKKILSELVTKHLCWIRVIVIIVMFDTYRVVVFLLVVSYHRVALVRVSYNCKSTSRATELARAFQLCKDY